jgi:hypothetical protein
VLTYLDVTDEHGDEYEPAGDGDDVEHDLRPLRRARQVPKGTVQHKQQQMITSEAHQSASNQIDLPPNYEARLVT